MNEKTIKLLNRSYFAVFSHFNYKPEPGESSMIQGYRKDADLFYVFRNKDNDKVYTAFHPPTMRYFNQLELYLQLSEEIPISQAFSADIEPLDEKPLMGSISKDDMLNFSCHLLSFKDDKDCWWGSLNLSNLFSSPFENAFFLSEPKDTLSMPLFLNGKISDFYDFNDDDFTLRYQSPGVWISKHVESNSVICLSFNPHTVFKYFCDTTPQPYLIICLSPIITAHTFDAIYKSYKNNNISHVEILSSNTSKELLHVVGFLCWWINYHSEFVFSISYSRHSATHSCIYPNDKRKHQLFLDLVTDCSTSLRGNFAISQGDEHSGLKHNLITPYNFASAFYSNKGRKSFDLSFYLKPEALMILCEKLLQLFDFMSPLTLTCSDSPSGQFAPDINLPQLED